MIIIEIAENTIVMNVASYFVETFLRIMFLPDHLILHYEMIKSKRF